MKAKIGCLGSKLLTTAVATGLVSFLAPSVQAQEFFDGNAIAFNEDTIIEFEFVESHGAYQAALGVRNETTGQETVLFQELKPYDSFGQGTTESSSVGNDNTGTATDFLGSVEGGTVATRFTEFTFEAGERYSFYLVSVSPTGQTSRTVLSTQNFARFFGSLNGGQQGDITGVRLGWEDGGRVEVGNDSDYDDFIIEAGGYLLTNCPPLR
ncbi:MAG: hypothetical protein WBG70_11390 [Spirulinaceae cyanobacterium]